MSTLGTRNVVDEAARALGLVDVLLGADDYDQRECERQILLALNLCLRALQLLRGKP